MLILVAQRHASLRLSLVAAILAASLFGFKIYVGLFAVIGWTLMLGWQLGTIFLSWKKHQNHSILTRESLSVLLPYAVFGVLSLLIFLPHNRSAGGLFWAPLAWPKLLLSVQYLDFNQWWLRRQVYEAFNNRKWLFVLDIVALFIAITGLLGTRLLGFWALWTERRRVPLLWWIWFVPGSIVFFFFGLFFLQSSGGYNVFNFFIVGLLSAHLLIPLWLGRLSRPMMIAVGILILLIGTPRPLREWLTFVDNTWAERDLHIVLPKDGLVYDWARLNTSPDTVVQPAGGAMDGETPWTPTFTQRRAYASGKVILESHNQPVQERFVAVQQATYASNSTLMSLLLRDRGISYLLQDTFKGAPVPALTHDVGSVQLVIQGERLRLWALLPSSSETGFCGNPYGAKP